MNIEKIQGKIKFKVEDFIVEEIGEKWICKISEKFPANKKPKIDPKKIQEEQDFIWCELEKFGIDHFNTIKTIASRIDKGTDAIGYAGTKDKQAHTSQRISIFKPNLEKLSEFSHPHIHLKNIRSAKRKIKLGYLDANHFKIVIRNLDKKGVIKISSAIQKQNWFPNYFGQQRFGSIRENNTKIGKLLLKRKFEEAVWEILTGDNEKEKPEIAGARNKLKKDKNFRDAQYYFPKFLRLEKSLIDYLMRNPDDYLGAIKRAERKNILMFVNAVQSKIFNEILETALEEGLDFTHKGQQSCLLVGYKTNFFDGRLGEIEQKILKNNDLKLSDFNIIEIPYLRIKGSFRKAIVEVEDLNVDVKDDDEFKDSKKITLEFTLPSGVYATTFLENFFIL